MVRTCNKRRKFETNIACFNTFMMGNFLSGDGSWWKQFDEF